MPSSASGPNLRNKNGTLAKDHLSGTTSTTTSTIEASSKSNTATTTATATDTNLKKRNVSTTNGNGHANGKPNGILSERKATLSGYDDEMNSSSDSIAEPRFAMRGLENWPYCPSFSVAFKALFLVRALGATYSNISDCDEVFNFWEPMHYLQYGTGLETWEYSPLYAIRSWAYILVHAFPAEIARLAMSANRLQVFFILRIILGAISAHCEATLYRAVVEEVDPRIGRYLLLALLSSAGTWIASNAFLPSTFAMYTTMLFFSQMLQTPGQHSGKRTFWAVFWVGLGGLLGWPFSAAVGLPFAIEELLIHSRDHSKKKTVRFRDWRMMRLVRLVTSAAVVLGLVLIPIIIVDHYYYKKFVVVPLNIVLYNVFGGDVGPDIFGTEPWWFYILNGLLNFNILFLAALLSFPALLITYFTIPDVLPNPTFSLGIKDPLMWFTLKLSPFYVWFAIFTAQPHKEERFLFVVYPLICFNAVLTLFMGQKIVQRVFDKFITRSKTSTIHKYAGGLVWVILIASAAVSLSRIIALHEHYNAPIEVYRKTFDLVKIPNHINIEGSDPTVISASSTPSSPPSTDSSSSVSAPPEIVRVCVGKEWYRFPSHYFLPEGARLGLIKSHFDGLLPGEFKESLGDEELPPMPMKPSAAKGKEHQPMRIDWRWSAERRPGTSFVPLQMNNENKEVQEHYITNDTRLTPSKQLLSLSKTPLDQCQYLIDLDYSGRETEDESNQDLIEPRYLQDKEHWEKLYCKKFLDTQVGAGRNRWVRAFWIPNNVVVALTRGQTKVWGDYCLARRKSI
ncbi:mannosyltransferase [Entomortierella chlamydospora]|uniref:Mannosyltransferase n=1 Tax=Entomortierella chlamydospora TaxID=101097 RepID=A0A9P6N1B0_9FUNG|nr:mannosyltransferase [Entomortierella chlamydospora]